MSPVFVAAKEEQIRSIVRTHPRLVLAVLGLGLLAAAGCVGFNNPEGWAGPSAADSVILASTDKGEASALSADDFSVRWTFPTGQEDPKIDLEAIYGAPVVIEGTAYLAGYSGDVFALALADGAPAWTFDAGDPIIAGLTAGDTEIYVATNGGTLYALDAEAGSMARKFEAGDGIWGTPLLADGVLYVASVNGKLFALDPETFDPVWDAPFETGHGLISDPVLADGIILIGGIDRALHAVDAATGKERAGWPFKADNWFWGRPLVEDGVVYAPNLDGRLFALDIDDGAPAWDAPFKAEEPLRSSPVMAGDALVIADRDGNVYGLDPENGEPEAWSPAVSGETVLSNPLVLSGSNEDGQDVEMVLISAEGGDLIRLDDPATGDLSRLDLATGNFVRVVTP